MSTEPSSYRCLSAAEAAALLRSEPDAVVFDVRDAASFRQGHVAGAAHLDFERFPAWRRKLAPLTPVVIYCYRGNASRDFVQLFADFRFDRVHSVDGGYDALAAALAG